MTKQELLKLKLNKEFIIPIVEHEIVDDYGYYSTGIFKWKGKIIVINVENGKWHLSVSCNHYLGYAEMKDIRYQFLPNNIKVAQIFPPREEFVNVHETCFHLYEISEDAY